MEILYEDDDIIAINKPNGMFVHRTYLDPEATEFVIQIVRDMVGHWVFPVHRLDRKTSGVLVLAKSQEVQSIMNTYFRDRHIEKNYLAIVRGFTEDEGIIDYDLENDRGKIQDAITHYKTIQKVEINISSGLFPTSRYSLAEVKPKTGRMHQIRKHMSHIFHPIVGDRPHGCNKQNKFFLSEFQMGSMLLHASCIAFEHPITKYPILIKAPIFGEFERMIKVLGFTNP
ncbi:MAG: pseudouridylate synthase [Saprospiraceae bacterium]|nr:pseudouridylate synthase [Saprospiraceae bacterium]